VVASTRDEGSVFYNPAGLGLVKRHQMSLTMTALALQVREIDHALTIIDPTGRRETQDVNGTHGGVISPSAAAVLRILDVPIGLGFFTTRYDVLDVTGGTAFDSDTQGTAQEKITLDEIDVQYHVGAGTGFKITPNLRLGGSLFVVYTAQDDAATLAASRSAPSGAVVVTAQERDMSSQWGGQLVVGAQYDVLPVGTIGILVRSPTLMLSEDPNVASFASYSQTGAAPFAAATFGPSRSPAKVGLSSPATFVLGFTHDFERAQLSVGGEYSPPLESLEFEEAGQTQHLVDRRWVINVRLGGTVELTDGIDLGLGLFTDRSPEKTPESFGDFQVNYYGVSTGVRYEETIKLAPGQLADDVVFRTVLALRYAYGSGETRGMVMNLQTFSAGSQNVPLEDGELIDVHFHEAYAYLGTAVDY
jgi:long-subunit fatty acid transport protein